MNRELLETQWPQIRDILMVKFSNLTEEDIRQINGQYDQLVTKLQQKYGYSREEAEERIRNWNFDRFSTSSRGPSAAIEDKTYAKEKVRKEEDGSSFLKWLFALGIPLLLLAYFFGTSNTTPTTPATTQEQLITENAADRAISDSVRNNLLSQPNLAAALQNIQITSHNGVVTLTGTVPNSEVRDAIVNRVQNFSGIRQVINNLQVR